MMKRAVTVSSLAMIAAWGVLGVVLAIRGFRWEPVEAG